VKDEAFFNLATNEYAGGDVDKALLAKPRVLAKGDEEATEFKYIELRVKQLRSQKTAIYANATKDAARVITPALRSFSWEAIKATLIGLALIGVIAFLSELFSS